MWQKAFVPGKDQDGRQILSVIGKRTYSIGQGKVTATDQQVPLILTDEYADPSNILHSEMTAESDLVAFKPSTDVVVTGNACAPDGKHAYVLQCTVAVGPMRKTINVYGERKLQSRTLGGFRFSDPVPFTEMQLGYSQAFGGYCRDKHGIVHVYPPNPIGTGFTIKNGAFDPEQVKVPRIEDPLSPVTPDNIFVSKPWRWDCTPNPVSFGWTRRDFYPRYKYAGIMVQKRSGSQCEPGEISGLDCRFFQGASDGLWGKVLEGKESVMLENLDSKYSVFKFELPGEIPHISIDIGKGPKELQPVLQTVIIDMKRKLLSMVWRGALEYGGIDELVSVEKIEYVVEGG